MCCGELTVTRHERRLALRRVLLCPFVSCRVYLAVLCRRMHSQIIPRSDDDRSALQRALDGRLHR